jgi:hypothetical protein
MAKGKATQKKTSAAKAVAEYKEAAKTATSKGKAGSSKPTKKAAPLTTSSIGVRRSLTSMQKEFDQGNHKPMDDLVRAWVGIQVLACLSTRCTAFIDKFRCTQALPPASKLSYFYFGSLHGLPFEERAGLGGLSAYERYQYWGGYCNHGNVLFPTWHRAYVLGIEKGVNAFAASKCDISCNVTLSLLHDFSCPSALQSFVPGISMPYWDATDAESLAHGVPDILTRETYILDGQTIKNPLRSYVLPVAVSGAFDVDNAGGPDYSKPKGELLLIRPVSALRMRSSPKVVTSIQSNTQGTNRSATLFLAWSPRLRTEPPRRSTMRSSRRTLTASTR